LAGLVILVLETAGIRDGREPVPRLREPTREDEMPYIIAEPCIGVKDKACVEVCPVDCIYEGETMLYIHPEECIDCGACEPVCPVKAIFAEDEVPDQWKNYIDINKQFFKDNPGVKPATKS
jgi:NAD-dependent dihydropyrimidine dehydrogenase PreA subunit